MRYGSIKFIVKVYNVNVLSFLFHVNFEHVKPEKMDRIIFNTIFKKMFICIS
jgi:hypothetical protein